MQKNILHFNILIILLNILLIPAPTYANSNPEGTAEVSTDNIDRLRQEAGLEDQRDIEDIAISIINVILTVIGILFITLLIYGGAIYMTAAGNQESVDKGKKIITFAVIGIAIILLSFSISNFIVNSILDSSGAPELMPN